MAKGVPPVTTSSFSPPPHSRRCTFGSEILLLFLLRCVSVGALLVIVGLFTSRHMMNGPNRTIPSMGTTLFLYKLKSYF